MDGRLSHLVFYDGECGLCDRIVQTLLKVDKHECLAFAPLQGETASRYLKDLPSEYKGVDSLILIENYHSESHKIYIRSKAAFRICWLIGGSWVLIGWLSFLPAFFFDWAYRLVAKNRHRLFPQTACILPRPDQKHRFLP